MLTSGLQAFGISEISDVSIKAKKMVDQTGLRYSDTVVFATEWIMNPLDSERAVLSINRVNFIHSRFKGIKDAQMLYTLCLLICEVFVRGVFPCYSMLSMDFYHYSNGLTSMSGGSPCLWRDMQAMFSGKKSGLGTY